MRVLGVEGLGFGVEGLGSGVWGSGLEVVHIQGFGTVICLQHIYSLQQVGCRQQGKPQPNRSYIFS